MDRLAGLAGAVEDQGIPKMSILVLSTDKDNGALYKKKLEGPEFKDIRALDYKEG